MSWLAAAGTVVLVLAGPAAAAKKPTPQKKALKAIAKAVSSGYLDAADARADRAEVARAARLARKLPSGRREHVAVALEQVAALNGKLSAPRAAAVFGQLKANDDYFSHHWAPASHTDVTDADGLVYRYFPGLCLEFHPLANFAALNAAVASGDVDRTRTLADALAARGVHEPGGGIGWEYDFDYAGGRAPWLSGMAQAVAAQAFARAAALVTDQASALTGQANGAYQLISPHLLTHVAAGPWIRLYGFSKLAVLNAQLQTVVSLDSYAKSTDNAQAASFATRLEHTAASMVGRFDTGFWSLYSLDGTPSPVSYQQYVVQLLKRLRSADDRFGAEAQRFSTYLEQPPAFRVADAGLGQVRFWLSKPSSVRLASGAGPTRRLSLGAGWHTVGWPEPKRPGIYGVAVSATDWAGNRASFQALPIVRVEQPPKKKKAKKHGSPPQRSTSAAGPAPEQPGFVVGAGLDDPAQADLATRLGVHTVRMSVDWPVDETAPDPDVVASLQRLPADDQLVLELTTDTAPADDTQRGELASYAASLVGQTPTLHDLVLAPAPDTSGAGDYAATFAAVATAVRAASPDVSLGIAVDGAQQPAQVVAALGQALAGTQVDLVAFQPAPSPASGAWTSADVSQLTDALGQAFQTAPPVLLDGLAGSPADDASAIAASQCSPVLAGVLLDRVADGTPPDGATDGVFTAGGTPKVGFKAVVAAIADAEGGNALCPGVASTATASELDFPTSLSSAGRAALQLGCDRACLYLVTLDRLNGTPVAARRGTLAAGAPATVTLPKVTLKPGSYRFDVRLVSQVNPGQVTRQQSPPLAVS